MTAALRIPSPPGLTILYGKPRVSRLHNCWRLEVPQWIQLPNGWVTQAHPMTYDYPDWWSAMFWARWEVDSLWNAGVKFLKDGAVICQA